MRTPILLAALLLGSGASVAAASSASDAARAVETASRGVAAKPYDLERERTHWEVKFADGSERHVSLDGRRVVGRGRDDRSSRVRHVRVPLATAIRTAGRRASGTVTDADLDRRRGRLVWEVSFEPSELEVSVDARTGRVVAVRHDD